MLLKFNLAFVAVLVVANLYLAHVSGEWTLDWQIYTYLLLNTILAGVGAWIVILGHFVAWIQRRYRKR